MIEVFHGIFRRLQRLQVPTIALAGAALGGGMEPGDCDMIVAWQPVPSSARPEIKFAVFPRLRRAAAAPGTACTSFMEIPVAGETHG